MLAAASQTPSIVDLTVLHELLCGLCCIAQVWDMQAVTEMTLAICPATCSQRAHPACLLQVYIVTMIVFVSYPPGL